MEMKVQIPFQHLLTMVKTLTPAQKSKLKQVLAKDDNEKEEKAAFMKMLLNGPVFTEGEIKTIEENRKSIAEWRTKS